MGSVTQDFEDFSYISEMMIRGRIFGGGPVQCHRRTDLIGWYKQLTSDSAPTAINNIARKQLPVDGPAFGDFLHGDKRVQRIKIYPEIPPYIDPVTLRDRAFIIKRKISF
jgi:hypothetical protein